jgi:type II secretory pathway pseudopilin PulG
MVVIVIIGILAAIAIPKLFGVSAKAKASEVGPAAGTWSKLQQAYVIETSELGDGGKIAYTPPGATSSGNSGSTVNFGYLLTGPSSQSATWQASNAIKLNDCTAGSAWLVAASLAAGSNMPDYTITVGGSTANSSAMGDVACGSLTPNFGKLQ